MQLFRKKAKTVWPGDEALKNVKNIILEPSSHIAEDEVFGDDDILYRISFRINDAFAEAKSHAGEITMLHTYDPEGEGTYPYLAMEESKEIWRAMEEFKETGTFAGAIELTALSGRFYFKAKMEYYGYMMYFYGMDCCDGFLENCGLCMVYPKAYVGTENERKLMSVLDEAAESYREEKRGEISN